MNNRLYNAFNRLEVKKQDKEALIPGLIGFMIGGVKTAEVQNRPGYVYVRLRNNTNELIIAFNDQVSPVYDLPVLVVRDEIDMSRYKIHGRDVGKYENWGSVSSYLPRHGNQHSFDPSSGGGGDVVWVYDKQLMPLALVPSGTAGSGNVTIAHDTIFQRNIWKSVGGTGTVDLLAYKPTGTSARLVLVYLDQNGNPQTTLGTFFDSAITGTAAIVPYLPYPPQTWDIPLGAVRLVSGTATILWDNIYDLRAILRDATTTGTSSGIQLTIQENGVDQTQRDRLNFVGSAFDLYDNGSATVVSGTLPTILPTLTVLNDFHVSGTSTFNGDMSVTGSIGIDTNGNVNGINFWDSITSTLQLGGKISVFVSDEEPPSTYFYYASAYGPQNIQLQHKLISGSSNLAHTIFGHSTSAGNYFLVDTYANEDDDLYIHPNYTQIGQVGRIGRGLVVGSRRADAGTVVPPTGTIMLQNVPVPASSPSGYTTIFSASGTPSAIDQSGNRYAMGRDYGASGSLSFVSLTSPLTSTSFDGDLYGDVSKTLIDLQGSFGAPAGIKAIVVAGAVRDTSSVANDCYFLLSPTSVADEGSFAVGADRTGDNRFTRFGGMVVACTATGDIYYQIFASGTGTFQVYLQIWGYFL